METKNSNVVFITGDKESANQFGSQLASENSLIHLHFDEIKLIKWQDNLCTLLSSPHISNYLVSGLEIEQIQLAFDSSSYSDINFLLVAQLTPHVCY